MFTCTNKMYIIQIYVVVEFLFIFYGINSNKYLISFKSKLRELLNGT